MSRLNKLIQDLCPDGVKFEPLAKLIQLNFGERITKLHNAGSLYPVYGGGGESFRTDEFNRQNEYVISRFAMSKECVRKVNGKFWLLDSGFTFNPLNDSISKDYIAYWLFNSQDHIFSCTSQGAQKNLNTKAFLAFRVPVPPFRIQEEIVRILDSFTSLEAELEAELTSRREQYDYYRDNSMTFDPDRTTFLNLGDYGRVFGGLTGKSKSDFGNVGKPYVTYSNVYNNKETDIAAQTYVQIGPAEHQNTLQQGDILLTGSSETPDEVALSSVITKPVDNPLYLNSFTIGIRPKQPLLDLDFAKHLFRSAPIRRQLIRTASGVTRFNVSKSRLAKVMIPIPDRKIQENIAAELDKFDFLANSLYSGLPAEIEARHKQYEYYRDRLLTFKELGHE